MIEIDFVDETDSYESFEIEIKDFFDDLENSIKVNFDLQKLSEKIEKQFTFKDIIENQTVIEVVLINDEKIKELNRTFRKINKITDVLSFNDYDLLDGQMFIGSIVISVETAKKQAVEIGNTFFEELKFLSLHGFLHLSGYNHETDKGEMLYLQKKIKNTLTKHFTENN